MAFEESETRDDDHLVSEVVAAVTDGEPELTIDPWLVRPKLDMTVEVRVLPLSKIAVSGALHSERFESPSPARAPRSCPRRSSIRGRQFPCANTLDARCSRSS